MLAPSRIPTWLGIRSITVTRRASPTRRSSIAKPDRYALTFHYNPSDETVAEPLDTCVGPDNPQQFEPKTFIQHLTDDIDAVYVPQQEMIEC